jgi:hypothetical protein
MLLLAVSPCMQIGSAPLCVQSTTRGSSSLRESHGATLALGSQRPLAGWSLQIDLFLHSTTIPRHKWGLGVMSNAL